MLYTAITGLKGLAIFCKCFSYVWKDNTFTLNSDKPIPASHDKFYLSRHHKLHISDGQYSKHVACVDRICKIFCG